MARSFRESRFRRRGDISEDVNPSAYIVNLADCMLVLACGFLVALVSFWNIDISPEVTNVDKSDMEQVDPGTMDSQDFADGSYYVEMGKVYQDPKTGEYFMVEEKDGEKSDKSSSKDSSSGKGSAASSKADGKKSSAKSGSKGSSSAGKGGDAVNARALGAD